MTPFRMIFKSYIQRNREQLITVVNGQGVPICGSGNIISESSIVLNDVLHVPQLANNLISVQKLTKDLNCSVTFFSTNCIFQNLATGKTILTAKEQSELYLLEFDDQRKTKIMSQQATSETWENSQIWLHPKSLGLRHPSFNLLTSLFPHLFTKESIEFFNCDICQLSKHHRASYPIINKKSTSPFDLIHSDVWGPVRRVTWTYLMKNKSEVFQIFVNFFRLLQNKNLALKEKLAAQFEMKDLGKLKYFLGIEVAYSKNGIFISQRKYVLDLLKETGKLGCRTSMVPIEQNHRIGSEENAPVDKAQYQRLVGKLIYLSHTRPNIAYAVSVVSQFMHDPRERHMQAVDKILQYLKSSLGNGLLFKRKDTLTMKIYTDADYAGSITDRKSTSGYCVFLGDSLVMWRSKKQDRVSRSSEEAEFRVLAQGMCEGLWMKIILDDLKVKVDNLVQLYCDNKFVMSIAHNPVQHDRIKHIEIDKHFIKDNLDRGFVITTHVPTELQIADIFTKGLLQGRFQDLVGKLRMIDIHLPT
uniref:Copia protein n=1 Tax=Cajanus cajan TaxID=3821 RepID=A0A151T6M3_CAJCA|nr:Copia protein [Cajanus cajan]